MFVNTNCFTKDAQEPAKKLGDKPYIHHTCKIHKCKIGSWTEIGSNTSLVETTFGDYSYAARDVDIEKHWKKDLWIYWIWKTF